MNAIIDFVLNIFNGIVDLLNVRLFSDMPITYLQLILACLIIPIIFNFVAVGFKEVEKNNNLNYFYKSSKGISNDKRKKQVNQKKGG